MEKAIIRIEEEIKALSRNSKCLGNYTDSVTLSILRAKLSD
jgi:hypothetical protein